MKKLFTRFSDILFIVLLLVACGTEGEKDEPVINVTGVTLSKSTLSMKVGEEELLTVTVIPANATDKTVRWASSNTTVATVSSSGLVSAKAKGTTTITATVGSQRATCTVTVAEDVIGVTSITLSETALALVEGETATLTATVYPANATDKAVVWSSSDAAVASVSDAGLVTAVKEGTAEISATAGNVSAQCTVTIRKNVIAVESITLSQTSLSMEEGQTAMLAATVSPADATDKTVTWTSSNNEIATVSTEGLITAIKEGTAKITASAGNQSATCTVTVKKGIIAVTSVTLSQTTLSLEEGETETLVATVLPSDATDKTISWTSSNAAIATVSNNGIVTAIKEGTATITATAGNQSATCTVTVKKAVIAVTSVSLSQTTLTLDEGHTATLVATVAPTNATDKTVTWTSSNAAVATVSSTGLVTAIKEGTTTVKATVGNQSATCTVTVKKGIVAVSSITLSQTTLSLEEGQTSTLTATISPSDATDKTVTWISSNVAVATVSNTGVVTAIAGGTTEIIASVGGKSAKCIVTVKSAIIEVASITLSETSLSLEEGQTTTLTATVLPTNATDKTITWASSNATVAVVSANGIVTAVKEGTATITASAGSKSTTCTVTVKKAIIDVTSITLSAASLSLEEGKTATLTATVSPSNATDKTVTWSSSDAAVATVSATGVVTAVKEGTATITAKAGNQTATCTVTVKKKSGVDATVDPWGESDKDYGGTVN